MSQLIFGTRLCLALLCICALDTAHVAPAIPTHGASISPPPWPLPAPWNDQRRSPSVKCRSISIWISSS